MTIMKKLLQNKFVKALFMAVYTVAMTPMTIIIMVNDKRRELFPLGELFDEPETEDSLYRRSAGTESK